MATRSRAGPSVSPEARPSCTRRTGRRLRIVHRAAGRWRRTAAGVGALGAARTSAPGWSGRLTPAQGENFDPILELLGGGATGSSINPARHRARSPRARGRSSGGVSRRRSRLRDTGHAPARALRRDDDRRVGRDRPELPNSREVVVPLSRLSGRAQQDARVVHVRVVQRVEMADVA